MLVLILLREFYNIQDAGQEEFASGAFHQQFKVTQHVGYSLYFCWLSKNVKWLIIWIYPAFRPVYAVCMMGKPKLHHFYTWETGNFDWWMNSVARNFNERGLVLKHPPRDGDHWAFVFSAVYTNLLFAMPRRGLQATNKLLGRRGEGSVFSTYHAQ